MDSYFLTLLQLVGGKDHAGGAAMTAKAALAFQQESTFQIAVGAVEDNVSEDLSSVIGRRDSFGIFAGFVIPLLLVEMADRDFLEIPSNFSLALHLLEKLCEVIHRLRVAIPIDLSRDLV
ncbi:hypothetical protein SprV_0200809800 [Sparganum proliferum]